MASPEPKPHEVPVLLPSGSLQLGGLLWLPQEGPAGETPALPAGHYAGVVICHPHPLRGGDMHNNVVAALAQGLQREGYATLRFDFRGVGASQGSYDDGQGEREDTRAALRFLAERIGAASYAGPSPSPSPRGRGEMPIPPPAERSGGPSMRGERAPGTQDSGLRTGRLALAGYSFGAAVAIAVAADEPLVRALIAVSPPTGRLDVKTLRQPGLPKLFLTGSADPIAEAGRLQEAVKLLPPPTACHIAPSADHLWWGHEAWLVDRVAEFLGSASMP